MIYHLNNSTDTVFNHSHVGNPVLHKSPLSSCMLPVGVDGDLELCILEYNKNSNASEENVKMINKAERQEASSIPLKRVSHLTTAQR